MPWSTLPRIPNCGTCTKTNPRKVQKSSDWVFKAVPTIAYLRLVPLSRSFQLILARQSRCTTSVEPLGFRRREHWVPALFQCIFLAVGFAQSEPAAAQSAAGHFDFPAPANNRWVGTVLETAPLLGFQTHAAAAVGRDRWMGPVRATAWAGLGAGYRFHAGDFPFDVYGAGYGLSVPAGVQLAWSLRNKPGQPPVRLGLDLGARLQYDVFQQITDERIYIRYEEPHLPHWGWAPRGSLFIEVQHASGRCTQFHYGLVNWGVVLRGKAW